MWAPTTAVLVHELIEARDDKQLLRFQKKLANLKLLIIDELPEKLSNNWGIAQYCVLMMDASSPK